MLKKLAVVVVLASFLLAGCDLGNSRSPVSGCLASAYPDPNDNAGIFKDGETTPDGLWKCVAESPDGPFTWVRSEEEQPAPKPTQVEEAVPVSTPIPSTGSAVLENPKLHHSDDSPAGHPPGKFDIGVKDNQVGLVFGWHVWWPGEYDAEGGGCDLVILTPGWYENLTIEDGRYEVYDVPSADYSGWVKTLAVQRADEQSSNYSCPEKEFEEIPQWESSIPSPP